MIGDVLHGRYTIVDKLGFGGNSTVWLARDAIERQYVALKINIASARSRETEILKPLAASMPHQSRLNGGHACIPQVLDEFHVDSPNGRHVCYTVHPTRSDLSEISFSRLFSLQVSHALAYGLVLAVAYSHTHGIVHGDIHLSNILLKLPSDFHNLSVEELYAEIGKPETAPITRHDGAPLLLGCPAEAVVPLYLGKHASEFELLDARLILSDFGEAFLPSQEQRLGKDCHTPAPFRALEARFEADEPLAFSSNIWSLATTLWGIIGMKAVFGTDLVTKDQTAAQHIDVLGPMPEAWWQAWEARAEFSDADGKPTESYLRRRWPSLEESIESGIQKDRRQDGCEMCADESRAFLALMRWMLSYRATDRPTAEAVLNSEWLSKWALPDYMKV